MTAVRASRKSYSGKPLKLSPALGGALAFLGIDRCLPLLHGSQGCTAFALVLAVRHFREAIPLQTTAMSELSSILGGTENLEQAIVNIRERAGPRLIGICSTALTEIRDEDIAGDLRMMRAEHPEWTDLAVVYASTPDFLGGLQEGWARAVEAIVAKLVPPSGDLKRPRQVNLLAGSHLSAGDIETLKDVIVAFGLTPIVLPDLSGSLDGHVPEDHVPTTLGGVSLEEISRMGQSAVTFATGEHMRGAAELLQRQAGVPYRVFDRLTGLEAFDGFVAELMTASGASAPARLHRQRSRLIDAMLDAHSYFAQRSVAIAAEPDLLLTLSSLVTELGSCVPVAVSTTDAPALTRVPSPKIIVGDLDDLEQAVGEIPGGVDLILSNAHAAETAKLFDVPLIRAGFPILDRLGQQVTVGYDGTRDLLFQLANTFIERASTHPDAAMGKHAH